MPSSSEPLRHGRFSHSAALSDGLRRSVATNTESFSPSQSSKTKSKLKKWMSSLGSKLKPRKSLTSLASSVPSTEMATAKLRNVSARDLSANMAAAASSGSRERLDSFLLHLQEIEERALALSQKQVVEEALESNNGNKLSKKKRLENSGTHPSSLTKGKTKLKTKVKVKDKGKDKDKDKGQDSNGGPVASLSYQTVGLSSALTSEGLFVHSPGLQAKLRGRSMDRSVIDSVSALGLQCSILSRYLDPDSHDVSKEESDDGRDTSDESLVMMDIVSSPPNAVHVPTVAT